MSKRSRDMAVRHLNRGVSFIEKGLYADAIQALEQAEEEARDTDTSDILETVLHSYADLLLSEGKEEKAFEKYTEAAEIITELSGKGYETTEESAGIFSSIAPILEKKGNSSEAIQKYELSVRAYEKLIERESDNVTHRSNAASTLNNLGALLAENKDYKTAQENFQKALDIMEEIPEEKRQDISFQFKMATILGNLLDLEADAGQLEDSEDRYRQLVDTYRNIVRADPSEKSYKERLSLALGTYGNRLALLGKKDESKDAYKEALEILDICDEPDSECALKKVTILNKLASHFAEQQYHESAKNNLIKALDILEKLLEANPADSEIRRRTVAILGELNSLVETEEASEAKLSSYGLIERLSEKLLETDPSNTSYRLNVAFSRNIKGNILAELNRNEEAVSELRSAIDITSEETQLETDDTYASSVSILINDLELFADHLDDREEQLQIYGTALNRLELLAESYPENTTVKASIAGVLEKIAGIMTEKENYENSEFILNEAVAIYDELLSLEPDNEEYPDKLSSVLLSLADLKSGLKDHEGSLELYLRLFRMKPEDRKTGEKIDATLTEMEKQAEDTKSKDSLLAEYEKLLEIREELVESDPGNTQYNRSFTGLKEKIAALLIDTGRAREGIEILISTLSARESPSAISMISNSLEKFRNSIQTEADISKQIRDYGLLLEVYDRLADTGLTDESILEDKAGTLERIAALYDESGSAEKARDHYEYALSVYTQIYSARPPEVSGRVKTGNLKCRLASLLTDTGRREDAEKMFRSSLDDFQNLLEDEPSSISYQENAAYILNNLGYLLLEEGLFREAKPLYENALKIYIHILDLEPDNASCKANAACTLNNLGYILENTGREKDALWMYEKARELGEDNS